MSQEEQVPLTGKPTIDYGTGSWHGTAIHSLRRLSSQLSEMVAQHTGSIGTLGSMAIAVNSLTGPAMLNLPATFGRSGIIPTCVTIVFVCFLSSFCCLHMANTISKVPGNQNFKKEVEFSEAFGFFWGRPWFVATHICFFCCVSCLNISSIVDTAQVVDTFFGHWWPWGGSIALQIDDGNFQWIRWDYSMCTHRMIKDGDCVPFSGEPGLLLTLGKLVVTLVFLPLALMDLKENAHWQILGFLILLATSLQFVVQFTMSGLHFHHASLWGDSWEDLFGVVLFNFALVIAIPAWLYEREPTVDVPHIVHGSSILSAVLYIVLGILGHLAMPNVSENMLESMMSGAMGPLMQIGASIFAFAIIGLGIPLFSVLTRLNLTGSGLCSERVGHLLAVFFPFSFAWMLYDGEDVTTLLSWGGVIFTSLVAFILPLILALHVVQCFDYEGHVLVYFGYFKESVTEARLLYVLVFLAVLSVVAALIGTFWWS